MIVLGIDPGYAITGYGILSYENSNFKVIDYGVITTKAEIDFPTRLEMVYDGITGLIKGYNVENISIEEIFFHKNTKTAIKVAQARGAILLSCQKQMVPIFEYTPLQVKQGVVGYGRAEKQQVQEMTKVILNLKERPKPDDAADALALAICHCHNVNYQQLYRA